MLRGGSSYSGSGRNNDDENVVHSDAEHAKHIDDNEQPSRQRADIADDSKSANEISISISPILRERPFDVDGAVHFKCNERHSRSSR